jgi:hypothetical protein
MCAPHRHTIQSPIHGASITEDAQSASAVNEPNCYVYLILFAFQYQILPILLDAEVASIMRVQEVKSSAEFGQLVRAPIPTIRLDFPCCCSCVG